MTQKILIFPWLVLMAILLLFASCEPKYPAGSFGNDLQTLQKIDDLHMLKSGPARVAVSGKLQGRIFTSSASGMAGHSFGWFNKQLIENGAYKTNIAGLGGEGRIWYGPEVGRYGLFFEPGTAQTSENVVTPPALNKVMFQVIKKNDTTMVSRGKLHLVNYAKKAFDIEVTRQISIFSRRQIAQNLKVSIPDGIACVGFGATTSIKNTGATDWQQDKGLLALWELGCMQPEPGSTVILPTTGRHEDMRIYFSPLDDHRLKIMDSVVFYKADANYLNKIGIAPRYAKPVFGSYHPEAHVLTIVQYNFERDSLYVNSHWEDQTDPYAGDVINVFNDGVTENAGPFGPFYELETSSSARALKVGEVHRHWHRTYHFIGDSSGLNRLAKEILGVDLREMERVF